jgi:hypothetical protein
MANVQQVDKIESKFQFVGEFCEIRMSFLDKIANAPVVVQRPVMKIEKKINDVFTETTLDILVPLSPSKAKFGEYRTTFFSDSLEQGIYKVSFSGYYPDTSKQENEIKIESEFEVFPVSGFQSLLDSLRIQLADNKPELYWIDDPDVFRWDDGELFNAFSWAMNNWNSTPPVSSGNNLVNKNNLLSFPLIHTVMIGAEYFALNQKYNLENFNKLSYSDDLTFNIDRASGILAKLQLLQSGWLDKLAITKKDYTLRTVGAVGIKSTRIPARALKQLSLVPSLSFLSSGSGF